MPDHPIHQIDYAPSTARPAWWNRRTAFFVVLVVTAMLSGIVVVPRVLEKSRHLAHQDRLVDGGEAGRAAVLA